MRASKASAIAALALLAVAPLPVASAISAAATPVPGTLGGVGDIDDVAKDTVKKGTDTVKDVVEPILPSEPADPPSSEPVPVPVPVPTVPKPPAKPSPEPEVVVPKPSAPKPPATTVPKPAPAPVPKPTEDKPAGSGGSTGGSTSGGSSGGSPSGGSAGGGTGTSAGSGGNGSAGPTGWAVGTPPGRPGPTLLGEPRGPEFASSGTNTSSISYSGASPLLPEANAGDPNISSLLIAGGHQNQAISPVAENSAGSIAGLLAMGTAASLMLFACAAYLKYGKRRPAIGKHKA